MIGLIGNAKAELESALQAFAVKKFLEHYHEDCSYVEPWVTEDEYDKDLKLFIEEQVGFTSGDRITKYVIISNKAMVHSNDKKASYFDFYQNHVSFEVPMLEALLLCNLEDYNSITKPYDTNINYILLDCSNPGSPLISIAKKYAKRKKMNLVLITQDKNCSIENSSIVSDPNEYLGMIQRANTVITDSFMTLWFAILNRVPFIVKDSPAQFRKIKCFMERLDWKRNFLKKIYQLENYKASDSSDLEQKISKMQSDAMKYLEKIFTSKYKDGLVDAPPQILKSECCGCYTCKEVCPVAAIDMIQDNEGFYYPHVNEKCINCGLCIKRCVKKENHQLVKYQHDYPIVVCAVNKDELIRMRSTSGGVFSSLARYMIEEKKGVVFGVKFDENMVAISAMATTMEEVEAFYGSKYVKSEIDGIYRKVKEQLLSGIPVLYSGLPCECAGLRAYLNKDYDNLLICEILCHAAPSPLVFKDYLKYLSEKFHDNIKNVKFREKSKGWLIHQCNMVVEFTNRKPLVVNARRNNYFRNFLINNISRPGCSTCSFTKLKRVGDLTIGDFWGIHKIDEDLYDNKGASCILINNQKGNDVWSTISTSFLNKVMTIEQLFKYNHNKPIPLKGERNNFFHEYSTKPVNDLLSEYNDLKSQ